MTTTPYSWHPHARAPHREAILDIDEGHICICFALLSLAYCWIPRPDQGFILFFFADSINYLQSKKIILRTKKQLFSVNIKGNIFVALKGTNSGLFADFCTNSSGIPMGVIFSKSKKWKNLPQNKNPGPNNPNSIFCEAIYVWWVFLESSFFSKAVFFHLVIVQTKKKKVSRVWH